ncbi:MAG: molybdate ABC transporter substrate-binding protein [Actinobacteria bacterium]|nr:molybdate ABC transporter substrate-binding protein [Actinomycetota bacterium]
MRRSATATFLAVALLATGCSRADGGAPGTSTLTVFAASSLTGAFTQIGKDFEAANPGTHVAFSFGPSDGLAQQIESEGTADVFASASGTWMDDVATKVGVTDRADFAKNRLVIITPPSDPANVRSLADLARPGVQVVLAAAGVPVGDYARQVLTNAGIAKQVLSNVVSNEQDDAALVAKITSGEADAALVYSSDVTSAVSTDVKAIPIPDPVNVIATYPIAVVHGTSQPDVAQAFVAYVTGPAAQATLASFGFLPPG